MSSKNQVLAMGCSVTKGHGLKHESCDPDLWVNRIFPADQYKVHNRSMSGVNNQWIFLETMSEILLRPYDIVLVGWSAIPRFNFHVGLELYSTMTKLNDDHDVNLNNYVTVTKKHLKSIGDNLLKLHNDHWDFLDLVKYVNALIKVQENLNQGKIFFVNTLGPWPNNYWVEKQFTLPSDLSLFEKNLLQVDTRNDDEIFRLYHMIHQQYAAYGGIQEDHWLNLYTSLKSMQTDQVSDTDCHPGYKSQIVFANMLQPKLHAKLQK